MAFVATVTEIYQLLDQKAPFHMQDDFDNSGFLVGRGEADVQTVLISLDITENVIEEAVRKEAQLIISHHPVIFHPARSITSGEPAGRRVLKLIQQDIAAICAHTNLDKAPGGVNDALAAAAGLQHVMLLHNDGIGRSGVLSAPCSLMEYIHFLKNSLGANGVRYGYGAKSVFRVAVGGGACGSMLAEVARQGCDTFVTADVKHDQFLDAQSLGLNLIDAGHFPTERVVCPVLEHWIREGFPNLTVLQSEVNREPMLYL